MLMRTVAEATTEEIRKFAYQHSQLTIHPSAKKETAVERLREVWQEDTIFFEETPSISPDSGTKLDYADDFDNTWYDVIIHRDQSENPDQIVQVSVNGKMQLVPRGETVGLRAPYIEVLKNAVEYRYQQIWGRDEGGTLVPTDLRKDPTPVYPMQIVKGPYKKGPALEAA